MMQLIDEWRVTVTWLGGRELDFYLAGNSLANVIKTAGDVRFKPEPDQFKIERIRWEQQAATTILTTTTSTIPGLALGIRSKEYQTNSVN